MRAVFLSIFMVAGFAESSSVLAETQCSPTQISKAEAEILVKGIPQALVAVKAGGAVLTEDWNPGASYHEDLFYFFFVATNGPGTKTTLLENGVIGYFAVNKLTGQVFNGLPEFSVIDDVVLAKIQAKIRVEHCVDEKLIAKYRDVLPAG